MAQRKSVRATTTNEILTAYKDKKEVDKKERGNFHNSLISANEGWIVDDRSPFHKPCA